MPRGNCYVTSEALWHLLGEAKSGWHPTRMKHEGDNHWFLRHDNGTILDPTRKQFASKPDYARGRGCGFLTKHPSKRARMLMRQLLWQVEREGQ